MKLINILAVSSALLITNFAQAADFTIFDIKHFDKDQKISVLDSQAYLLKEVSDIRTAKKISIDQAAQIVRTYYQNEFVIDLKQTEKVESLKPVSITTDFIQLVRLDAPENNYYKDGIFAFYCNTHLTFNDEAQGASETTTKLLVTLDGKWLHIVK